MPVSREIYSVKVQMVLACIPIIDLWAAYRIEKLRVWLLFWTGLILLGFTINPESKYDVEMVIHVLIGFGIALFLMRYLTIEWNRKIKPDSNLDNFT